jgi:CTP:molybdopterin cytidylyltransferase MocA
VYKRQVYQGIRGHPLLTDRKYMDEILDLDGPDGLRGLASQHPDDILEVATGSQSNLRDIYTREDYLNEISNK